MLARLTGGFGRLTIALVAVAFGPGHALAQIITATSTGASGNWDNPGIWTTDPIAGLFPNNGQPTAANIYTVQIGSGATITLNVPITIDQLTFQFGTIVGPTPGANSLNVNTAFNWSGGAFVGAETISALGGATISNGSGQLVDGATLNIGGSTSTWSGGNITLQNGATLNNLSGSVLTVTGDGQLGGAGGTQQSFVNSGTFIKSGSSGTTTILAPLTNNGVFAAASGTVQAFGPVTNNGTLLATGGAALLINGTLSNLSSNTLTGGTYQAQTGSVLSIPGTVATIGPNTTVQLDGTGSVFSAIDSVNAISGTFRLTSGRAFTTVGNLSLGSGGQQTAATLDVQSPSVLNVNGALAVNGPASIPNGTVNVTGPTTVNSTLVVGQAAVINGTQMLTVGGTGVLTVQGTVNAPINVTAGGMLTGNAILHGDLTIQPGGFLSPGNSPGTILVGGSLTLMGNYNWDLGTNDASMAGGTFDQVTVMGATTLDPPAVLAKFGAGVDFRNSFWSKLVMWPILTSTGGFVNTGIPVLPDLSVDSTAYLGLYPHGSFYQVEQPNALMVVWDPGTPITPLWTGNSNGNWSNAGNWAQGNIPVSSISTQLSFGPTANPTMTNDLPGTLVLNSMTFNTGAPAFTLTGNGLEFRTNSVGAGPQIVTNSSNNVAINVPLTLTNNLTVNGTGNLSLNGLIVGAGSLTMSGTGTLIVGNNTNAYTGGTNVLNGTLQVANDGALGSGNVTGAALGTLSFTGTTTTAKSFAMNLGTIAVAGGQMVTFHGSQVSGAFLDGAGTFATDPSVGAAFTAVTSTPSVSIVSKSAADRFVHFTNGGKLTVAAGINTNGASATVNYNGFTNQASGSVVVGAGSQVNVANFQSIGTVTLNPATVAGQFTLATNLGSSPLTFGGGSRTFIGTPATATGPFVAGVDMHGQNLTITSGLFVNNGFVVDSLGTAAIVSDYGAFVKGAGFFQNSVITQNGGKFQAGNSPGAAAFGRFVFGPGGVDNYVFAIDDATGTAGPIPDAAGHVSGWGLVKATRQSVATTVSPGDFTWTATPSAKLTVAIDTLLNPTTVGTDVSGPMADFDPTQTYVWPAVNWAGTYSGPADAATLNADTAFDLSGFANPLAGSFGWNLDRTGQTLSLDYTPTPVPEPGTAALAAVGLAVAGWAGRRRSKTDLTPTPSPL